MLSVFCSPARYVQGREATRQLGAEMARLGLSGFALVIASKSARKILAPVWGESLGAAGIGFEVLDFGGECSIPEIERGKQRARGANAASVIGAGGGKVLDAARAVASELNLPVVCCPTTASSDAPCSALSVVYTPDGVFEKCLFYKRNPDLVLVDTSVIARAPVRLLVAGMGDALATWFEADAARTACKRNQVGGASTQAAAALAELCYRTLMRDGEAAVQAVKAGAVTPALERIVEANTLLSGLGFESGGLAVAHSVHNGLTVAPETHDRLHGEKVAFGTLVQLVLEGRNSALVEEVMGFCLDVGLPVTLAELGLRNLTPETARAIAERATAPGETAHNEAFEVTPEALMDALLAADAWGRAFSARRAASGR
jgi:glycerol dehydrogenase